MAHAKTPVFINLECQFCLDFLLTLPVCVDPFFYFFLNYKLNVIKDQNIDYNIHFHFVGKNTI
jgi:hypothetical protein